MSSSHEEKPTNENSVLGVDLNARGITYEVDDITFRNISDSYDRMLARKDSLKEHPEAKSGIDDFNLQAARVRESGQQAVVKIAGQVSVADAIHRAVSDKQEHIRTVELQLNQTIEIALQRLNVAKDVLRQTMAEYKVACDKSAPLQEQLDSVVDTFFNDTNSLPADLAREQLLAFLGKESETADELVKAVDERTKLKTALAIASNEHINAQEDYDNKTEQRESIAAAYQQLGRLAVVATNYLKKMERSVEGPRHAKESSAIKAMRTFKNGLSEWFYGDGSDELVKIQGLIDSIDPLAVKQYAIEDGKKSNNAEINQLDNQREQ